MTLKKGSARRGSAGSRDTFAALDWLGWPIVSAAVHPTLKRGMKETQLARASGSRKDALFPLGVYHGKGYKLDLANQEEGIVPHDMTIVWSLAPDR